jgi:hypothetical protein
MIFPESEAGRASGQSMSNQVHHPGNFTAMSEFVRKNKSHGQWPVEEDTLLLDLDLRLGPKWKFLT